jgi:hypothetical protein
MKTLIACIALGIALGAAVNGIPSFAADNPRAYARDCFERSIWNANPQARPCARVNIYEDSSARVIIERADGIPAAVCSIPNPHEESGRFRAHCERAR